MSKPIVKLVGEDGNAFSILGRCRTAARKAGMPKEQFDAFMEEATSGDYNHLLATVMKYFDEESERSEDDEEDEDEGGEPDDCQNCTHGTKGGGCTLSSEDFDDDGLGGECPSYEAR